MVEISYLNADSLMIGSEAFSLSLPDIHTPTRTTNVVKSSKPHIDQRNERSSIYKRHICGSITAPHMPPGQSHWPPEDYISAAQT